MLMTEWLKLAKKIWNTLLDYIFPKFCLGCNKEGSHFCYECLKGVTLLKEQVCPICYRNNGLNGRVCKSCENADFFLDGLWCASSFEKNSLLRNCIHSFKYEFIEELALPLAKILSQSVFEMNMEKTDSENCLKSFFEPPGLICPVPLHPKRQRFRGFNQTELLADEFIKLNRGVLQKQQFLERIYYHKPQMELKREDRIKNVENAFRLSPQLAGIPQNVILLDDVATTLSTLNACAKALKKADVKQVYGLVLARVF